MLDAGEHFIKMFTLDASMSQYRPILSARLSSGISIIRRSPDTGPLS